MSALGATTVAIVALALLWLALAVSMTVIAARRFRMAEQVLGAARANATLLELNPARPLVVRPDQKIEVDAQLARDLGLQGTPARLSELVGDDSGILAEDFDLLKDDLEAARLSAGRISRKVRTSPSGADLRGSRRPRARAGSPRDAAAVVRRYQRGGRGAIAARAAATPDRGGA